MRMMLIALQRGWPRRKMPRMRTRIGRDAACEAGSPDIDWVGEGEAEQRQGCWDMRGPDDRRGQQRVEPLQPSKVERRYSCDAQAREDADDEQAHQDPVQDDGPEVGLRASSAPHSHPQRKHGLRGYISRPAVIWSSLLRRLANLLRSQRRIVSSRAVCSDRVWPFADANAEQSDNEAAGNVADDRRVHARAFSFHIV